MNLSDARILLTNDDGIEAEGLRVLERSIKLIARDVWVIAPESEQSASGHSLTLRSPLRIRKVSDKHFAINGTPTDSVLLGISEIMKEELPTLILSGINRGGNLGEDITYSGTVAAAMEGVLLGIRSIAFSQVYSKFKEVYWETASEWIGPVLDYLEDFPCPPDVLMNVNFPSVKASDVIGIEPANQGRRKSGGRLQSGVDPRGDAYFWIGPQKDAGDLTPGTDFEVVLRGAISVKPLGLDLSHSQTLRKMRAKAYNG